MKREGGGGTLTKNRKHTLLAIGIIPAVEKVLLSEAERKLFGGRGMDFSNEADGVKMCLKIEGARICLKGPEEVGPEELWK